MNDKGVPVKIYGVLDRSDTESSGSYPPSGFEVYPYFPVYA